MKDRSHGLVSSISILLMALLATIPLYPYAAASSEVSALDFEIAWSSHGQSYGVDWSPSDSALAFSVDANAIVLRDATGGRRLATAEFSEGNLPTFGPVEVRFSPDGRLLAVGVWSARLGGMNPLGRTLSLLNATTLNLETALEFQNMLTSFAWSPDGSRIVVGTAWLGPNPSTGNRTLAISVPNGEVLWETSVEAIPSKVRWHHRPYTLGSKFLVNEAG
ncbi:MAG: WD40 repeat domain-containing protein [Thermoplasmata archaeon]